MEVGLASKVVILIGDGMGDRPVAELGLKTPLEAANTPNMDRVAREGECGLMDLIGPGIGVGSDTAHLALLGYNPYEVYTGRGPFEAAGIGMEVKSGDIAFRCNFATVNSDWVVEDRRAGRIREGTAELAKALDGMKIEDITCLFKESVEHRAALVLRGSGLGHRVSDVDPHKEGKSVHLAEGGDEDSKKTARVVNEFVKRSYEILKEHPVNQRREKEGKPLANIVLPRGGGMAPHILSFKDKYGLSAAGVVEVGLIKGICRYLGMKVVNVPGSTGSYDTDIEGIGEAVVEAWKVHDLVFCNVKGPDVGGHDANVAGKVGIIERIDELVGYVLENIGEDTLLVLTADHSTPIAVRDHSGDPVPLAIYGMGVRVDGVSEFGERAVAQGGLCRIRGQDLMNILTNLLGVQAKFGA